VGVVGSAWRSTGESGVDKLVQHARTLLARELNLDVGQLFSHQRLREDLGMDSIIALNLIFAAERDLNLTIREEDIVRLTTVADLEDLLGKLCGSQVS
jgi:acyl carrier protein